MKQKVQLTLNFDAVYSDSYASCREFIAHRAQQHGPRMPLKAIAADMDLSPSSLSRKLAQAENDSQRFTLDDAEKYMEKTDDITPVFYWIEKYVRERPNRLQELKAEVERLEKLEQQ